MKSFFTRISIISCAFFLIMCTYVTPAYSATNSTQALTTSCSIDKTNKSDLFIYLNGVLKDAGFSDATRDYLTKKAREQLAKTNPKSCDEDKRTLKRNLSMFFYSLAEKNPAASDAVHKQYFIANQSDQPWDLILSTEGLANFKANHVFDHLTVEDVNLIYSKFCPFWPFCEK